MDLAGGGSRGCDTPHVVTPFGIFCNIFVSLFKVSNIFVFSKLQYINFFGNTRIVFYMSTVF